MSRIRMPNSRRRGSRVRVIAGEDTIRYIATFRRKEGEVGGGWIQPGTVTLRGLEKTGPVRGRYNHSPRLQPWGAEPLRAIPGRATQHAPKPGCICWFTLSSLPKGGLRPLQASPPGSEPAVRQPRPFSLRFPLRAPRRVRSGCRSFGPRGRADARARASPLLPSTRRPL